MSLCKNENEDLPLNGPSRPKPKNSSNSDINILLLGETGVGKSTFINSFANYMKYETFETAINSELLCLIPVKFTIPDENFKERYVQIGNDKNEDLKIGNTSTQGTKSYLFPIDGNRKIRLIDTPGIGDTRGMTQDHANFENILDFISQYDYLHAICLLLRPDISRINAYFKFCFSHFLMFLEKSALKNVIFVFTNTRSTLYRPSDTVPILRSILEEVQNNPPYVKIPFNVHNIFCLDNGAFRILVALKNDFKFSSEEILHHSPNWEVSAQTIRKLLAYVTGKDQRTCIIPHLLRNTIFLNDVRKVFVELSNVLNEILDLIQEHSILCETVRRNIARDEENISVFKKDLFIPVVYIKKKDLPGPVTICTSHRCSERIFDGEKVMHHYKQRCHDPCNCVKNIPKEHKGAPELLRCLAMQGTQSCGVCKCPFGTHMHIYYKTEKVNAVQSVKAKIETVQAQIQIQNNHLEKLQNKKAKYEEEKHTIVKSLKKMAYFLKTNSCIVFTDGNEDYVDYLFSRERNLGNNANQQFIDQYVVLKKKYKQEKELLESIFRNESAESSTNMKEGEIQNLVLEIYALKHTGKRMKQLHELRKIWWSKQYHSKNMCCHRNPISRKDEAGKPERNKLKTAKSQTTHQQANNVKAYKLITPQSNFGKDMAMIKKVIETADLDTMTMKIGNLQISKELKNELANKDLLGIIRFVYNYFEHN